jgi:hypothetical protein
MKASELRIGNLFIEEHSDKIIEVIGLKKNRITFTGNFYGKWQAKPILLTEEWLLKFGFEKMENNWKCLDLHFATISWERLAGLTLSFEKESTYLPHIKYVHQLQNLHFALTGEELIINN